MPSFILKWKHSVMLSSSRFSCFMLRILCRRSFPPFKWISLYLLHVEACLLSVFVINYLLNIIWNARYKLCATWLENKFYLIRWNNLFLAHYVGCLLFLWRDKLNSMSLLPNWCYRPGVGFVAFVDKHFSVQDVSKWKGTALFHLFEIYIKKYRLVFSWTMPFQV